ncbi:MAG: choice-of-anchor L domain-containing protein, partial [Armatimonadetes bacterium]|nr:choice-of-anchor L domain-containing protein [Armatimonadota bacterium]
MKSESRWLGLVVVLGCSLIAAFTWGSAGGLSGGKTVLASVTLTNPTGGETWQRGMKHSIRWVARGNPGSSVSLSLCGEGVPDRAIATSLTSKGEHDWTIPEELQEGRYKVKIVSESSDAVNDESDSTFEIYAKEPGKLTVKSAVKAKAMNVVNASLAVTAVTDIPVLLQALLSANHRLQNVTASFVQGPLVQTDSTPNPTSTGIYTNTDKLFGVSPGMIISSGDVAAYGEGPNTSDWTSTDFMAPGADILTSLSNGYLTYDATIFRVEFDTDATTNQISFQFVFGSEEYPEWVGSPFNDSFGLYVDGDNIAHDQLGNL